MIENGCFFAHLEFPDATDLLDDAMVLFDLPMVAMQFLEVIGNEVLIVIGFG